LTFLALRMSPFALVMVCLLWANLRWRPEPAVGGTGADRPTEGACEGLELESHYRQAVGAPRPRRRATVSERTTARVIAPAPAIAMSPEHEEGSGIDDEAIGVNQTRSPPQPNLRVPQPTRRPGPRSRRAMSPVKYLLRGVLAIAHAFRFRNGHLTQFGMGTSAKRPTRGSEGSRSRPPRRAR
jgi:hypothetical protein